MNCSQDTLQEKQTQLKTSKNTQSLNSPTPRTTPTTLNLNLTPQTPASPRRGALARVHDMAHPVKVDVHACSVTNAARVVAANAVNLAVKEAHRHLSQLHRKHSEARANRPL